MRHRRPLQQADGDVGGRQQAEDLDRALLDGQRSAHPLEVLSLRMGGLLLGGGQTADLDGIGEEAGQPLMADELNQLAPGVVGQRR